MNRFLLSAAVLLGGAASSPAADKPPPGKWDVSAFNLLFRVVETTYDESAKQVRWTVETKDNYRTLDFLREVDKDRPFVFAFRDANDDEIATVRLTSGNIKGIPRDEKVIPRGAALVLTLELPGGVLAKTKTVVLRRKE